MLRCVTYRYMYLTSNKISVLYFDIMSVLCSAHWYKHVLYSLSLSIVLNLNINQSLKHVLLFTLLHNQYHTHKVTSVEHK